VLGKIQLWVAPFYLAYLFTVLVEGVVRIQRIAADSHVQRVERTNQDDAEVDVIDYWWTDQKDGDIWHCIVVDGEFGKKAFAHGGDPITSVYLHLFPALTRMDAVEIDAQFGKMIDLPTAGLAAVRFQGTEIGLPVNVDDHCSNGIAGGDASRSSADKGARFVDHLVTFCSDFVEHMRSVSSSTKAKSKGEYAA